MVGFGGWMRYQGWFLGFWLAGLCEWQEPVGERWSPLWGGLAHLGETLDLVKTYWLSYIPKWRYWVNSCPKVSEIQMRSWRQLKIEAAGVDELSLRDAMKWKGKSLRAKQEIWWGEAGSSSGRPEEWAQLGVQKLWEKSPRGDAVLSPWEEALPSSSQTPCKAGILFFI